MHLWTVNGFSLLVYLKPLLMAEAARSIDRFASSDAYLDCFECDAGSGPQKGGFEMFLDLVNFLAASLRLRSRVHQKMRHDHTHVPDVGLAWIHC